MIKVDLNVSILLKEYPFLERFDRAAGLGFKAVEFYWEKDEEPGQIARQILDADLQVAAFNLDAGDLPAGDRGLLNDPERGTRMRENVPVAIELARKIGCRKVTALAGNLRPGEEREKQLDFIRENLRFVCEEAAKAGITVMVEAINGFDNRFYPFTKTDETLAFIDSVGAPNLKYLYDIYHMQRMEGNIITTLKDHIEKIGHIQIADAPGRNHPGTGEINYGSVLQTIAESGYQGSVGLEYTAPGSTEESLGWLPKEHRRGIYPESLNLSKRIFK